MHDLTKTDQLKTLGNGVVPQQAALALSLLVDGTPTTQNFGTYSAQPPAETRPWPHATA